MKQTDLLRRGHVVDELKGAVNRGVTLGLNSVPNKIKEVIRDGSWRDRIDPNSQHRYQFPTFEAFMAAPVPDGLEATYEALAGCCVADAEARDLLDQAVQHGPGPKSLDNVQGPPTGNSESAALRRLRKDRPDLHRRVLSGEIKAHAAAVEAGFRKPTATVPVDSPEAAVQALLRRFKADQLRQALEKFLPA